MMPRIAGQRHLFGRRGPVLLAMSLSLGLLTTGCSGTSLPTPSTSSASTRPGFGPLGRPNCTPASPFRGDEVRATPGKNGLTSSALLQGATPGALRADEQGLKLVMRVTGTGPLHLKLVDPTGTRRPIDWGPEEHATSNFDRPGDEWGLGVTLNRRGCWTLTASRDSQASASYWFSVS